MEDPVPVSLPSVASNSGSFVDASTQVADIKILGSKMSVVKEAFVRSALTDCVSALLFLLALADLLDLFLDIFYYCVIEISECLGDEYFRKGADTSAYPTLSWSVTIAQQSPLAIACLSFRSRQQFEWFVSLHQSEEQRKQSSH